VSKQVDSRFEDQTYQTSNDRQLENWNFNLCVCV
jgi:hypothetical protein